MKAIEFKNVSFKYDSNSKKVLDNISFFIDYGKMYLLSGVSGTGKSTVMSLAAGIIPNVIEGEISGEIFIDGKNIAGERISEISKRLGVVLQNAESQIINDIVEDEIAFGCENFAFPPEKIKERIDNSCSLMGIDKMWKTRFLSGGQKQRLITASTLATGQKILILDEPLANLDNVGADLLLQVLRKLADSGYSILIIEHRIDTILPYVDKIYNIEQGKIYEVGDKDLYLSNRAGIINYKINDEKKDADLLLKAESISYGVKGKTILNNISLEINKGERVLFCGENGCGKTTIIRLLTKLILPNSGILQQFIDKKTGNRKGGKGWFEKVGIVYQNPNYQLFMPNVKEEIYFGAYSKEYAEEMIEIFEISHLLGCHPHSLSEGQKRKVTIAAVCASRPQLLVLDEPTVGQDFDGLKKIVDNINRIHLDTGNTVITVTHDRRCALALCDRTFVFDKGSLLKAGGQLTAKEFFNIL